jgi:hypothetical protein
MAHKLKMRNAVPVEDVSQDKEGKKRDARRKPGRDRDYQDQGYG